MIPILTTLPPEAMARRAWFVDIWGVMHNGVAPFATAVEACRSFRRRGGAVILVSNAPRPRTSVTAQLDSIGVARDAYDGIVSSGDIARSLVGAHAGRRVLHIGPPRDRPLFDGLGVSISADGGDEGTGFTRDGSAELAAVVCTGLVDDERETPDDYRAAMVPLAAAGIPMICANPDLTVERGGRLIPCAGAVARLYESLGGRVDYAGKPYRPIYDAATAMAEKVIGLSLATSEILAIGDGIRTDIDGAIGYGLDNIFVASIVSMGSAPLTDETLERIFRGYSTRPMAAMAALAG